MYVIYDYQKCRQDPELWIKRNKECHNIITYMRENNITALEESGKWVGLPSIHELKLIMRLSSTLDKNTLIDLIKKLPFQGYGSKTPQPQCNREYKKIYRVVKNI